MLTPYNASKEQAILLAQHAEALQETAKFKAYRIGRYVHPDDLPKYSTAEHDAAFLTKLAKSAKALRNQNASLFKAEESQAAVTVFMQTQLAITTKNIIQTNEQYAAASAYTRGRMPARALANLLDNANRMVNMDIDGKTQFFRNGIRVGLEPKQIHKAFDFMCRQQFTEQLNRTDALPALLSF